MPECTFPLLGDAKASPRRQALHSWLCKFVRNDSDRAPNKDVATLVSLLAKQLGAEWNHYFRDHMPGGRFHPANTSEAMKMKLLMVPSHNRLSEEGFGLLDMYFNRSSKRAGLATASASVLARRNGTLQWYYALPLDKRRLFDEAMRDPARQQLVLGTQACQEAEAKARALELQREKCEKEAQREAERSRRNHEAVERRYFATDEEIDSAVQALSGDKRRQLELVKAELRGYKAKWGLVQPDVPPSRENGLADQSGAPLWQFSHAGKQLDLDALVSNLKLIRSNWARANDDSARAAASSTAPEPVDARQPARDPATLDEAKLRIAKALEKRTGSLRKSAKRTDAVIRTMDNYESDPEPTADPMNTSFSADELDTA